MTLWIAILLLTLAAVACALWPFLFGRQEQSALAHAIAFYDARTAELERLEAEGQITAKERAAAEAEQARRLIALKSTESEADVGAMTTRRRKLAVVLVMIMLPAIALATYLKIGSPSMPDQPLAARQVDPQAAALLAALKQIEAHLAQNPNDGKGFEVVAPVYLRMGRFDDAARAFGRVIELLGETPERLADQGESLMAAASGTVTPEARQAFERSVKLDPAFAKSRFYLALGTEQSGDAPKAHAELVALASSLPAGDARERVMAEINRMKSDGKVPKDAPGPAASGPASEAGKAIAEMSEAERNAAIRNRAERSKNGIA
jgi:cytochrome c-type biogenesis protein CcmH